MASGSVNVPGVDLVALQEALDDLKAEIISGRLTTPLATAGGETIQTVSGEDILAVQDVSADRMKQYAEQAAEAAAAAVRSEVASFRKEYNNSTAQTSSDIASLKSSVSALDNAILAE